MTVLVPIEICVDGIDNDGDVDCFDSDCINTTNATISADKMAVCAIGSVATITSTGGGTYKWSTGDSTDVIQTKKAGLYTVTVTNGLRLNLSKPRLKRFLMLPCQQKNK